MAEYGPELGWKWSTTSQGRKMLRKGNSNASGSGKPKQWSSLEQSSQWLVRKENVRPSQMLEVFPKLLYQLPEHSIHISASLPIRALIVQKLGFLIAGRACINSLQSLMCCTGNDTVVGSGGFAGFVVGNIMIRKGKWINYVEISDWIFSSLVITPFLCSGSIWEVTLHGTWMTCLLSSLKQFSADCVWWCLQKVVGTRSNLCRLKPVAVSTPGSIVLVTDSLNSL